MSKERKDTRVHLVAELEKVKPRTLAIEFIITEARAGEYHDYKNKKYACGKVAAYTYLSQVGLTELAQRVADGEFDEVADEEDKAEMRKGLPEAMWKTLGLMPGQN